VRPRGTPASLAASRCLQAIEIRAIPV